MSEETAVCVPPHCALPDERISITHKFTVGTFKGYLTVGVYPDGKPGEIFIKTDKEGSTLKGMLNAFAIAISMGFQHGIPLDKFVEKFKYMRFEPEGSIGQNAFSIVDYIFRWLEEKFPYVQEIKESYQSKGQDSGGDSGNGNGTSKARRNVTSGSSTDQSVISYAAAAEGSRAA